MPTPTTLEKKACRKNCIEDHSIRKHYLALIVNQSLMFDHTTVYRVA